MNIKQKLEKLYTRFNTRDHVASDPIEFLYAYPSVKDREIAGFVTACLAYGRVAQIKKSVSLVLSAMGPSPHDFLTSTDRSDMARTYKGFVHRFARDTHLVGLLWGLRGLLNSYGSLEACMAAGDMAASETLLPALNNFVKVLVKNAPQNPGHLVPIPEKGSAAKRLHLFMRWMIRKDAVDPGGWDDLSPSRLIVPVDVHMHRICTHLAFTQKKQANLKTAVEVTQCFRKIMPQDPVKYDFALTRIGIEQHDMVSLLGPSDDSPNS